MARSICSDVEPVALPSIALPPPIVKLLAAGADAGPPTVGAAAGLPTVLKKITAPANTAAARANPPFNTETPRQKKLRRTKRLLLAPLGE
jgi:hypothetical protein